MSAVKEALLGRRVLVWLFLVVNTTVTTDNSVESVESVHVVKNLLTLLKTHQKCSKPVVNEPLNCFQIIPDLDSYNARL